MSMLSKALKGIRFDKHTLGNLVKNAAPLLAFTPVGAVGAGVAAGLGGLARGESLKDAAISGVKNASIGAGARAGVGALRGALQHGASAATTTASTAAGPGTLPNSAIDYASNFGPTAQGQASKSLLSKSLGFVKDNPTATSMGLNAVSNLSTAGAQNRTAEAQADLLEQQQDANAYELERRKKRDLELDPLYGGIGSALGASLSRGIAPNPYATRG